MKTYKCKSCGNIWHSSLVARTCPRLNCQSNAITEVNGSVGMSHSSSSFAPTTSSNSSPILFRFIYWFTLAFAITTSIWTMFPTDPITGKISFEPVLAKARFVSAMFMEISIPLFILTWITVALGITLFIIIMIKLYQAWEAVQSERGVTSPGKAVGFTFIPFFNFYWLFVAIPGLFTIANKLRINQGKSERPFMYKIALTFVIVYLASIAISSLLSSLMCFEVITYNWAVFLSLLIDACSIANIVFIYLIVHDFCRVKNILR